MIHHSVIHRSYPRGDARDAMRMRFARMPMIRSAIASAVHEKRDGKSLNVESNERTR